MKRWWLVLLLVGAALLVYRYFPQARMRLFNTERFGGVKVFSPTEKSTAFIVLFSEMADAKSLIPLFENAMVAVISPREYLGQIAKDDEACSYLAGEVERLGQSLQSSMNMMRLTLPVLAGAGEGAALAYAVAAQYPPAFRALLVIGPAEPLRLSKKLCDNEGLKTALRDGRQQFEPATKLPPWAVVGARGAENLAEHVAPVAEGKPLAAAWQALQRQMPQGEESDLPIIELEPTGTRQNTAIIFYSGDGGWAALDRNVAERLRADGYPVLGVDCLRAFWKRQTPEAAAQALEQLIERAQASWNAHQVFLVGFSFGADLLPLIVNRLGQEFRSRISGLALLSPTERAQFEIHISDWIGVTEKDSGEALLPELERLAPIPFILVCGEDDERSICPLLPSGRFASKVLRGDHHFEGNYDALAGFIEGEMRQAAALPRHSEQ